MNHYLADAVSILSIINYKWITGARVLYQLLIHYKRSFKYLKLVKENQGKVLVLGNASNYRMNWGNIIDKNRCHYHNEMDENVVSGATRDYSLILCMDPITFCKALHLRNIPIMTLATAAELNKWPEILTVTDYLLPTPTSKHDAALCNLVRREVGLMDLDMDKKITVHQVVALDRPRRVDGVSGFII